jgi:hypothetical protein
MPNRSTTKSPLQLARLAYAVARKALDAYSGPYSRHDFTQAQLFVLLVLRQFFQTDYRGIIQLVSEFSELRQVLELKRVPHFTTLQKAEQRLLKKGPLSGCWTIFFEGPTPSACFPQNLTARSTPPAWKAITSADISLSAVAG